MYNTSDIINYLLIQNEDFNIRNSHNPLPEIENLVNFTKKLRVYIRWNWRRSKSTWNWKWWMKKDTKWWNWIRRMKLRKWAHVKIGVSIRSRFWWKHWNGKRENNRVRISWNWIEKFVGDCVRLPRRRINTGGWNGRVGCDRHVEVNDDGRNGRQTADRECSSVFWNFHKE